MPGRAWNLKRLRSESGYWRSCILITAAHLDLFGWIGKQEKSPRALAAHFGGSAAGWEIFLNALCSMGLLRKRGGKYANGAFAARCLSRGGATSLLPAYDAWNIWGGLAAALTLGKRPAMQRPFVSDRSQAERLLHSLDVDAREIATYLIKKLPLSRSRTLLDVGGGLGSFFRCVLSTLSEPARDPRRTSSRSSSGASGYRSIRYGKKSADSRGGFLTGCSATGIRYRICLQRPARPRRRCEPLPTT